MGTNYYAKIEEETFRIHLGKNSSGWRFTIREQRDYYRDAQSLFDFVLRPDVTVENEYGEEITPNYFIGMIIRESREGKMPRGKQVYSINGFFFKGIEFC